MLTAAPTKDRRGNPPTITSGHGNACGIVKERTHVSAIVAGRRARVTASAWQLLDRRYAYREIGDEEYRRRRTKLR